MGILSNSALSVRIDNVLYPTVEHFLLASMLDTGRDRMELLSYGNIEEVRRIFNRLDEARYFKIIEKACDEFFLKKARSTEIIGDRKTCGAEFRKKLESALYQYVIEREDVPLKTMVGMMPNLRGYNLVGLSLEKIRHLLSKMDLSSNKLLEDLHWRLYNDEDRVVEAREYKFDKPIPPLSKDEKADILRGLSEAFQPMAKNPRAAARPIHRPSRHNKSVEKEKENENKNKDDEEDVEVEVEVEVEDGIDVPQEEEVEDAEWYKDVFEDTDMGIVFDGGDEDIAVAEDAVANDVIELDETTYVPTDAAAASSSMDTRKQQPFLYLSSTAYPTLKLQEMTEIKPHDALSIYKMFRVADHLIQKMQAGMDIADLMGDSLDAILWKCRISPEIFGVSKSSLDPRQRRQIYIDHWNEFQSKTIRHYPLLLKEILYPGNLVGFIRKEYIDQLNPAIGVRIRNILFFSFLAQVVARSYPAISGDWVDRIILRESKKFSPDEFHKITDSLYHLFFAGKFTLAEEDTHRILLLEKNRVSLEQIEEARQFIPGFHPSTPPTSVQIIESGSVLDPLAPSRLHIHKLLFTDAFQYIYFSLYKEYGNFSNAEAYPLLFQEQTLLPGNHPLLQARLAQVIETRRYQLTEQALRRKFETYPQVREILYYLKASGTSITFTSPHSDTLTDRLWKHVLEEEGEQADEDLMRFVLASIGNDFERDIFLYSFLQDFIRNVGIFRKLIGRKIGPDAMKTFLQCFYKNLLVLRTNDETTTPLKNNDDAFYKLIASNITTEAMPVVWNALSPYMDLFRTGSNMVPSQLFEESRKEMFETLTTTSTLDMMIDAMIRIISCLYNPDSEIPMDELYRIVQIMSGSNDIPKWIDSSFEDVEEVHIDPAPANYKKLPETIRQFLPKPGRKRIENVVRSYHLLPMDLPMTTIRKIAEKLHRPSISDPIVSRVSFAISNLKKHLHNPRRLRFFT